MALNIKNRTLLYYVMMTFEQAKNRLQEIKTLLESGDELTLTQIQELQNEAKECYDLCQKLLRSDQE